MIEAGSIDVKESMWMEEVSLVFPSSNTLEASECRSIYKLSLILISRSLLAT